MLVATKDKFLTHEAVGFADLAAKTEMPPDALFWIASQSKPITAAALMLLADDGKLSLDDPVEKHLPEFRELRYLAEKTADHLLLRRPRKLPTLRHLLSHTSGMPFKTNVEEPTLDRLPLTLRSRSYAVTPLDFPPEARYQYSNAGINTAARVVEVVGGEAFESFLERRLFKPLGMHDTTFWPSAEQAKRLAKAYQPGPEKKGLAETTINQLYYPLTDRSQRHAVPAGGLFSTAHDIARFYQMLLGSGEFEGRRILSQAAVAEMIKRQTPPAFKESYGLGLQVSKTSFGHGGAYSTDTTADLEKGLILVWLVQHNGFPGEGAKAKEAFQKAARGLKPKAELLTTR